MNTENRPGIRWELLSELLSNDEHASQDSNTTDKEREAGIRVVEAINRQIGMEENPYHAVGTTGTSTDSMVRKSLMEILKSKSRSELVRLFIDTGLQYNKEHPELPPIAKYVTLALGGKYEEFKSYFPKNS